MPEPVRVLTSPLRVAGGLGADEVASAVAADALLRRAWVVGSRGEWSRCAMAADQASQHALERELAREGRDRATVGDAELADRAAAFGAACRAAAAEVLAAVGVVADELTPLDEPPHVVAARTAFVRLFDEGMIERQDRVVATCPRCATVVDGPSVVAGHVDTECLSVRFDDGLVVDLLAPELLPGVAAVAVPEGDERAGTSVMVPLSGREVPVVAADVDEPMVVVPAHDPGSHELAGRFGLSPVVVLGGDGTVVAEGPLAGQARYAARAAARDVLAAEGRIAASAPAAERLDRCACCGTVVVPLLGRHWFLRFGELAGAAADLVRDGAVEITPPEFRDLLLSAAAGAMQWCLSGTVVGGVRMPVATCHDCGRTAVEVDERGGSCGRCMGTLEAADETLDALFVAAIWPLVAGGWPAGAPGADTATVVRAVVTPTDLVRWALPALALGARLAGLPFTKVVVHPLGPLDASLDDIVAPSPDSRAARLALLAGRPDASAAIAAVDAFDAASAITGGQHADPELPAAAVAGAEAVVAALDDGAPAQAGLLLEALLGAGVPAEAADRVHALVLPLLGA